MQELRGLLRDGAGDAWMRVTERGDADTREQVEVLSTFGIEQSNALSAHEANRVAAICLQNVLGLEGLNVFER